MFWRVYPSVYDRLWDQPLTDYLACRVANAVQGAGLSDVLEIGAGTGLITRRLEQADINLVVSEPNPRMRERATRRLTSCPISSHSLSDWVTLASTPSHPRTVVAANVVHLATDRSHMLELLRRVAGQGGAVIVLTPADGANLARTVTAIRRRGGSWLKCLEFLALHLLLTPLIALTSDLRRRRQRSQVEGFVYRELIDDVSVLDVYRN